MDSLHDRRNEHLAHLRDCATPSKAWRCPVRERIGYALDCLIQDLRFDSIERGQVAVQHHLDAANRKYPRLDEVVVTSAYAGVLCCFKGIHCSFKVICIYYLSTSLLAHGVLLVDEIAWSFHR